MNWTLLFIAFITLFLISMILIYFSSKPSTLTPSSGSNIVEKFYITWKW